MLEHLTTWFSDSSFLEKLVIVLLGVLVYQERAHAKVRRRIERLLMRLAAIRQGVDPEANGDGMD